MATKHSPPTVSLEDLGEADAVLLIGCDIRAEAQQGTLGARNLNVLTGIGLENGWSFVAGASQVERDAERIADKSSIAFDPSENSERTNTDMSGISGYLASSYAGKSFVMRASLLHADVERGVAAQGDLDPAVSRVRFWRTPEWRLTQATLNSTWDLSSNLGLRFTGWQQWFEQTIDAYTDYSYSSLQAREQGEDAEGETELRRAVELNPGSFLDYDIADFQRVLAVNLTGVFAAGDVRSGSTKRVASAVGEGSICVSFIHQVLSE